MNFTGFSKEEQDLLKNIKFKDLNLLSRISIGFNTFVNTAGTAIYNQVRKLDYSVPKEEARQNMHELANDLERRMSNHQSSEKEPFEDLYSWSVNFVRSLEKSEKKPEEAKEFSLEEKLLSYGDKYVSFDDISKIKIRTLWKTALEYDKKGIIPQKGESLVDFVYRGNTLLFLHKKMREHKCAPEIKIDEKNFDVNVCINYYGSMRLITEEDIKEANKKIPYHMDLSWMAGFVDEHNTTGVLLGAYGVCFTLPKHNGFNFLLMRKKYKSREDYLKVLAHEMTHMGTVYLDTRKDFLETKAYIAGSAAFGEHTIAINQRPPLTWRIAKGALYAVTGINIPNNLFRILPKIASAASIRNNQKLLNTAKTTLQELYGKEQGNYLLGRLSADDIEELVYTNNVGERIRMNRDLKWRIMKHNVKTIN